MAESPYRSEQYTSEAFVESAGAVLFRLSSREICVRHLLRRNEYVLAKGRRNCEEACRATAMREVKEETGFTCRLLPLDMYTCCPPAVETEQLPNEARFYKEISEPFTLQIRHLGEGQIKLIWWYVAAIEEGVPQTSLDEQGYTVEFYSYEEVLEKLTYQMDRDMVKKAIELVENKYSEV